MSAPENPALRAWRGWDPPETLGQVAEQVIDHAEQLAAALEAAERDREQGESSAAAWAREAGRLRDALKATEAARDRLDTQAARAIRERDELRVRLRAVERIVRDALERP